MMDSDSDYEFAGFVDVSEEITGNVNLSDSDIDVSDVSSEASESDERDRIGEEESQEDGGHDGWTADVFNVEIEPFNEYVGPTHKLEEDATELDYFYLMFDENFFHVMVDETNRYARQNQRDHVDKYWTPTYLAEMKAFIAINILMGIHQLPDIDSYWSSDNLLGCTAIQNLMPKTRYKKLSQYIHLMDNEKMPPVTSSDYDRLYKVRNLIRMLNFNFSRRYNPHRELSIDEAMIRFKGRSHMKQYTPAKPTKWGLKVWTIADPVASGYVCGFEVYTGRRNSPSGHGLGFDVINSISEPFQYKRHHLYFDNYFSSVHLLEHLLEQHTYACATFRVNRRGLPQDIKNPRGLSRGDSVKRQRGNLLLCAWKDKKTVHLMSTNSDPSDELVKRRSGAQVNMVTCPSSVVMYNRYMGGVDLADQHRSYYNVGREAKKMWKYLLWYGVNIAIVNAFLLYKMSYLPPTEQRSKKTHLQFRLAVVRQLIAGFSGKQRQAGKRKVEVVVQEGNLSAHDLVKIDGRKRVCVNCKQLGKKTPAGRGKETSFQCRMCKVPLCQTGCLVEFHERHKQ